MSNPYSSKLSCDASHLFPGRVHFKDQITATYEEQGWFFYYKNDGSTPDLDSLKHIEISNLFKGYEGLISITLENGASLEIPIKRSSTPITPEGLPTIDMPKVVMYAPKGSPKYQEIMEFIDTHYRPILPEEDEAFGMERYEAQVCEYNNAFSKIDRNYKLEFHLDLRPYVSPIASIVVAKVGVDYKGGINKSGSCIKVGIV
ncbi:MAG: hypothetical protein EA362_00210 [Saprospirales bacterium]|nr:MAG: hypothetical protein EA362_00210 [Saprospirales bacterium]